MALPSAYLTEVRKRNPRLVTWVEIEGLEWGFSNDTIPNTFTSRWNSGAGSTTGPKGVKPTLLAAPTPVELTLDPLETIANIGQTVIRLHDAESLIVQAVSVHRVEDEVHLDAELSASATSLTYIGTAPTGVYPTGGGTIYLDAETIKYTSHDTGTRTFSGLTRGMYGARAVKHIKGRPLTYYPRFLKARKLVWYMSRHPDLTSTSDEVKRFRGVVTDYSQTKDASAWEIVAEHDLRRLDWEMFSWQATGRIVGVHNAQPRRQVGEWFPIEVEGSPAEVVFDDAGAEAIAVPEASEDGNKVWVDGHGYKHDSGRVCAVKADSWVLICETAIVGVANHAEVLAVMSGDVPVPSSVSHRELQAALGVDNYAPAETGGIAFKEIWDVNAINGAIWHGAPPPAPGSRASNDSFATRCLQVYETDNPIDIMLAHLLSDGIRTGTNYKWFGLNGSGNGLDDGWAGFTTDEVDVAKFEEIRNKHFWSAIYRGWLEKPTTIREFLTREILKPYGLYFTVLDDGTLSLRVLSIPATTDPAALVHFDESEILSDPAPHWTGNVRAGYLGAIITNPALGGRVASLEFADPQAYYGRRGEHLEIEVENREFYHRSPWALRIAGLYKGRFEYPGPHLALSTDYSLHEVAVGDVVRVSVAHIPDTAAGSLGLTERLAHVISKRIDDMAGQIDWVLEITPETVRRYCRISPTMEVEGTGGGGVVTVKANSYSADPDKDWDDFRVDDRVRVTSRDFGTVRFSAAVITAINAGTRQVTLDSNAGIGAGDVITLSDYATTVASSPAAALGYAFMADSNADLDPAGDTNEDRRMYVYIE